MNLMIESALLLLHGATSLTIDSSTSHDHQGASKIKLTSIAIASLSLLIGTLFIFTVQLDRMPKEQRFAFNNDTVQGDSVAFRAPPPLDLGMVIKQECQECQECQCEKNKSVVNVQTSSPSCEECEVQWWPPRYWTQQSKYSPVAETHHGLQMYGTLGAQQAIWNHQNPSSCRDKKFLVYKAQGEGHGIGSVIHVTGVALEAALNLNRILVLFPQPNFEWVQGKFCEGMDTMDECYFEPLSSCTIMDAFGDDLEVSADNLTRFPELNVSTYNNNSERVLRSSVQNMGAGIVPFLRIATPPMFRSMLDRGNVNSHFYYWWRAQSSAYIVRPTLRTLRELDQRRVALFQGRPIEPGTISMHVRHGDKWKEMKLESDETWMRTAEALLERYPDGGLQRRIFLSTEDPNTVQFFARQGNWSVQYTNVSRVGDPKMSPGAFAAIIGWDEEFLNSLLSLQLALECDGFVGAIASNWNRLIDELRSTVRSKYHRVYVDVVQGFNVQDYSW